MRDCRNRLTMSEERDKEFKGLEPDIEEKIRQLDDVEPSPERVDFVEKNVLPEVYADDKSDEEIIIDGFWNMFEREEQAFAEYRANRRKNRRRL